MKFGRLDGHELPVILAADGQRLCLYTPDDNSCLFETALDFEAVNYSICFADVDRDLSPDILVGYYYNAGVFQADTVCKLEFYTGESGYATRDSFFYVADDMAEDSRPPVWSFVDLTALDVDGDNLEELFFSYDRFETSNQGEKVLLSTSGHTRLYSTFPESITWERSVLLSQMQKISLLGQPDLFASNRYEVIALLPGNVTANGWVEIISSGGDSLLSLGETPRPACVGDSSVLISLYECLAVGDMNLACSGPEILVRTYYRQTCYDGNALAFDSINTQLRLYSVGSLPGIDLLWTDLSPGVTSNFRYLPQFPGSFFSANSSWVGQHDGLSGEMRYLSEELNADTLIWTDNPDIASGELIGIRNQTLTVYSIDASTDIEGNPPPENLPSSFDMGNPHPNPFNSVCVIDYCLPTRTHIRIEVYNVLGQKVKSLFDDVGAAGRHQVEWDATDLSGKPAASGVYLIKLQAEDFTDSKKVLLLK